jgi:predicted AlkP superfamily pyrophosphatase or phosphodiesterase
MMRTAAFILMGAALSVAPQAGTQVPPKAASPGSLKMAKPAPRPVRTLAHPKLIVVIVVDQMRADYVDKFLGQWTGGLKRLVEQGAWFREAAYPYAATETCVGHATISTGAVPATHGIVANTWWDRDSQKMMACTSDAKVKNSGYAGTAAKGGDSAWRLLVPTFTDELRFQSGAATRVVAFSLKARAAIMLGGHKADAVTWADGGGWVTSNAYGTLPFIDDFVKAHPIREDYGKTWTLSLSPSAYLYDGNATGAVAPDGWDLSFPHSLRGKGAGSEPDREFYGQWATSPFADIYLTKLAENAIDQLGLGKSGGIDYLGVSYSSPDYVGHAFGPRSWEIQDTYVKLDKDLGELLAHLDAKVGAGNYVVALSADHGVVPVPEDMQKTGADAGILHIPEVQQKIEDALRTFAYTAPTVAQIANTDLYFSAGIYDKLKTDPAAMKAVLDAIRTVPGVADVYRAEELVDRPATNSPIRSAEAASFFAGRSGDLLIVPKPYWLASSTAADKKRDYGTGHGTPYYYDQRVPIIFWGWGIQRGEYFGAVTPADIAPTLASLCGITLATRDGRVLSEALLKKNTRNKVASAQ